MWFWYRLFLFAAPSADEKYVFWNVRFFRHLILFLISLLVLLPSAGFISVTLQNNRLVEDKKLLSEQNQLLLSELAVLSDPGPVLTVSEEPQIPTEPDSPKEASFSYQELYPDLYCNPASKQSWPEKTAFLTLTTALPSIRMIFLPNWTSTM
jgi:hypothetical protein